jgi:hypothetical protein
LIEDLKHGILPVCPSVGIVGLTVVWRTIKIALHAVDIGRIDGCIIIYGIGKRIKLYYGDPHTGSIQRIQKRHHTCFYIRFISVD